MLVGLLCLPHPLEDVRELGEHRRGRLHDVAGGGVGRLEGRWIVRASSARFSAMVRSGRGRLTRRAVPAHELGLARQGPALVAGPERDHRVLPQVHLDLELLDGRRRVLGQGQHLGLLGLGRGVLHPLRALGRAALGVGLLPGLGFGVGHGRDGRGRRDGASVRPRRHRGAVGFRRRGRGRVGTAGRTHQEDGQGRNPDETEDGALIRVRLALFVELPGRFGDLVAEPLVVEPPLGLARSRPGCRPGCP